MKPQSPEYTAQPLSTPRLSQASGLGHAKDEGTPMGPAHLCVSPETKAQTARGQAEESTADKFWSLRCQIKCEVRVPGHFS